MTKEYKPGTEDIYISVSARPDGLVAFEVFLVSNHEKIYGLVLPPETARYAAQKLTLASWRAEEMIQGENDGP